MNNSNAKIRTRRDRTSKLRTETVRRDAGAEFSISTDPRTNSTALYIDLDGVRFGRNVLQLNGREARTLFRMLAKHYGYTGKSFAPIKPTLGA